MKQAETSTCTNIFRAIATSPVSPDSTGSLFPSRLLAWHRRLAPMLMHWKSTQGQHMRWLGRPVIYATCWNLWDGCMQMVQKDLWVFQRFFLPILTSIHSKRLVSQLTHSKPVLMMRTDRSKFQSLIMSSVGDRSLRPYTYSLGNSIGQR